MTRRAHNPAALAAARASAERMHRALDSAAGMPLAPMTPRERAGAMLAEARHMEATGQRKRAWARLREATGLLRAAGVPLEALAVGMGTGRAA